MSVKKYQRRMEKFFAKRKAQVEKVLQMQERTPGSSIKVNIYFVYFSHGQRWPKFRGGRMMRGVKGFCSCRIEYVPPFESFLSLLWKGAIR